MFLGPCALREKARGLVRPNGFLDGGEADEAFTLGDNGAWWAEHGGGVGFIFAHGDQALRCGADSLDFVILAGLQPVEEKNLFELHSVRRVRSVDDEDFAAEVFDRFDFRLRDEFILRAFAAHHDDYVLVREVDHGHSVVHREISEVAVARGEFCAQLLRIRGVFRLHFEAGFGEKGELFRGDQLQRPAQQG